MNNLTLLVKTFERPKFLLRLLTSVEEFYPRLSTIVVDDSAVPYAGEICGKFPNNDFRAIILPYDSGLSAGRNAGLDAIKTPYFCLCDDDHYFDNSTVLLCLMGVVADGMDIAGGYYKEHSAKANRWDGLLVRQEDDLWMFKIDVPQPYGMVDVCQNFFVAKTDKCRTLRWEDRIKIGIEHVEFFMRAKEQGLKVAHVPGAYICHRHPDDKSSKEYTVKRRRHADFRDILLEKHGLKRLWQLKWPNPVVHTTDAVAEKEVNP